MNDTKEVYANATADKSESDDACFKKASENYACKNGENVPTENNLLLPISSSLDSAKNNWKSKRKIATRTIAETAVLTAMVMVATMIGFSTGQFYFNVGDAVILIGAAIFGPVPAMIAGGIGSFFADMAVYPATMVFTLFIKGIEGLVCGLLAKIIDKYINKKIIQYILSALSMALSAFIMAAGYFICQSFMYGTLSAALIALPMDAMQASVSVAVAFMALYPMKLIKFKR